MIALALSVAAALGAGFVADLAGADLLGVALAAFTAAVLVEAIRDTIAGSRDRRHAYARWRAFQAADAERRFREEVERNDRRRSA